MSLLQKMRSVEGYNTRGSYRPKFFLLHKDDVAYVRDAVFEENERAGRKQPSIEQLRFNGTLIVESPLAQKGSPLVVMGDPLQENA